MCFSVDDEEEEIEEDGEDGGNDEDIEMEEAEGEEEEEECNAEEGSDRLSQDTTKYLVSMSHYHHVKKILKIVDREKSSVFTLILFAIIQAAASLTVGVGSFEDPDEIPGLMHFLEHMVFMGSEKYPKENSFDYFMKVSYWCQSRCGMSSNDNFFFLYTDG